MRLVVALKGQASRGRTCDEGALAICLRARNRGPLNGTLLLCTRRARIIVQVYVEAVE
jgi:ABC-type phosphate/phosphonate transport system permease subunit